MAAENGTEPKYSHLVQWLGYDDDENSLGTRRELQSSDERKAGRFPSSCKPTEAKTEEDAGGRSAKASEEETSPSTEESPEDDACWASRSRVSWSSTAATSRLIACASVWDRRPSCSRRRSLRGKEGALFRYLQSFAVLNATENAPGPGPGPGPGPAPTSSASTSASASASASQKDSGKREEIVFATLGDNYSCHKNLEV